MTTKSPAPLGMIVPQLLLQKHVTDSMPLLLALLRDGLIRLLAGECDHEQVFGPEILGFLPRVAVLVRAVQRGRERRALLAFVLIHGDVDVPAGGPVGLRPVGLLASVGGPLGNRSGGAVRERPLGASEHGPGGSNIRAREPVGKGTVTGVVIAARWEAPVLHTTEQP